MKKLLIIFFLLIPLTVFAPDYPRLVILRSQSVTPYESLFKAICEVESGGNRFAYNKKENAVGIVQIRPIRLKHFNKLTGKNYKLVEMYEVSKAKEVFLYFCNGSYEEIAKNWNGSGKMTEVYWIKVKNQLKSNN